MTTKIFTDRSCYEDGLRCARLRYLGYAFGGIGIRSAKTPLPLAVGGSVHEGLAALLRSGQAAMNKWGSVDVIQPDTWMNNEDGAVRVALADFAQYAKGIELPDGEQAAIASAMKDTPIDEAAAALPLTMSAMDEYLYKEQSALVEALVRAYARRRLRPLLAQYEVLEVEREGQWLLTTDDGLEAGHTEYELWFMSRPDALLRERDSNQLYLLSYKTAASWDIRKARDAEHDMQGMSEGIEVERRLALWWDKAHNHHLANDVGMNNNIYDYLAALDAPPRILGVRMEYMLKGYRDKDDELSERFGRDAYTQRSHLIRQYYARSVPQRGTAAFSLGDVCWSWKFTLEDGRESKLAYQNWTSHGVFEAVPGGASIDGGVKEWIDILDSAAPAMSAEDPTVGMEPRVLGYQCDGQRVGYTAEHPLDAVFIPPMIIFRNDDELRDMVEQLEAVERRVAEGVAAVNSATDADEVRSELNVHFPMTRRACEYPTTCSMSKLCYGGEDIRRDPVGSGLYKIRVPNHPQENPNG